MGTSGEQGARGHGKGHFLLAAWRTFLMKARPQPAVAGLSQKAAVPPHLSAHQHRPPRPSSGGLLPPLSRVRPSSLTLLLGLKAVFHRPLVSRFQPNQLPPSPRVAVGLPAPGHPSAAAAMHKEWRNDCCIASHELLDEAWHAWGGCRRGHQHCWSKLYGCQKGRCVNRMLFKEWRCKVPAGALGDRICV